METGFEKATNQNLPVVDSTMVFEYCMNNPDLQSAELKNRKASRATRESYGDKAIGYVQVKRVGHVCIVKAKITPEHKVHNKGYTVVAEIDEANESISKCQCLDCAASKGGCKHSLAFLLWLHRRSEEPSVTSVECYWKVSILSKVGSSEKWISLPKLAKTQVPSLPQVPSGLFEEILSEGKKRRCGGTIFQEAFESDPVSRVSLHKLILKYKSDTELLSAKDFIDFIKHNIPLDDCAKMQSITVNQHKSSNWYEVRYGRITASKLYESSRCTTFAGSLVEDILGGGKLIETEAMSRGKRLEKDVMEKLAKLKNIVIQACGIYITTQYPIFGASPDGITDSHVVEIKCPMKDKTVLNYIDSNGRICKKPYTQIQLQMLMTGKSKGYFCVAAPNFEISGKLQLLEVSYDPNFLLPILEEAEFFWKTVIFTHLIKL